MSVVREIWIVEGIVTDPEAYNATAKIGDTEWQFSDGPVGERGSSADYLSLEEGMRDHPGCIFHFEPQPEGSEVNPHLPLTPAERANIYPSNEFLRTEAALCAWEYLLTRYDNFEEFGGAGQARCCCTHLADAIHVGYCIANVDDRLDGWAYDWEFVPWFMENCVIWGTEDTYIYATPPLVPDWVEKCRKLDFEPSETELLESCLQLFNEMPNTEAGGTSTYDLAAKISRRLKS